MDIGTLDAKEFSAEVEVEICTANLGVLYESVGVANLCA